MCTRLVIAAGSPHALYDMHISQVLPKFVELTGDKSILNWSFGGFRRIETAREEIAELGVAAYTAKRLVTDKDDKPIRTLIPIAGFTEASGILARKISKSGLVTFVLMKNSSPQGAGWYLVTEGASHGVLDRNGHMRQPWVRQPEKV
jgi:hypothetical protein